MTRVAQIRGLIGLVGATLLVAYVVRTGQLPLPNRGTASPPATPRPLALPEPASPVEAPPPPLAPRLPGINVNAPIVPAARIQADPANPASATKPAPLTAASAASPDIRTDLEEVLTAIRDFRNSLGGNPVGTNAEITKALLGDNLKQIKFPIPTGSSINGNGEMCDRWGTPYFFHQLSRDKMEVRSAGPDRQMWTADDRQM